MAQTTTPDTVDSGVLIGSPLTLRMPDGMLRALAAAPGSSPLKLAAVLHAAAT